MIVTLASLSLAAVAAPCPVERAGYVLRDDPAVTARFHAVRRDEAWPAGVALAIRLGRSGRTYWLLPANGGTNGRTSAFLIDGPGGARRPTSRAGPGTAFLSADARYRFRTSVPRRGRAGPPAPSPFRARGLVPGGPC